MSDEIKTGDVVYLKSGGPAMTVNGFLNNGKTICSWFVGDKSETANFFPDALTRVNPKGGIPAS